MCCLSKDSGAPVGLAARRTARRHAQRTRRAQATRRLDARRRACSPRPGSSRSARTSTGSPRTTSAHVIAEAVANRWPGAIDPERVRTNLVVFRPPDADALLAHLERMGCSAARSRPASSASSRTSISTTTRIRIAQKAIASAPDRAACSAECAVVERSTPTGRRSDGGYSGRSSWRSARIWRHSPMARRTSTAITAVPIGGDDRPDERADRCRRAAVARALEVDEAVADQAATQAADEDGDERENSGTRRTAARRARRSARRLRGVHGRQRRLRRRASPGRAAHVQRGARHRTTCSRKARAAVPHAQILVVDDGSPDGTADLAEALGRELGNISVMRALGSQASARPTVPGFRAGLARDQDVLIEMDSDLSHDPAALPSLLAAIDDGADLVIGSRYVPGGTIPELGAAPPAVVALRQSLRWVRARTCRSTMRPRVPRLPRVRSRRSTSAR